MKKLFFLIVALLLSLISFSCSVVKHCDLRFCHFTVRNTNDQRTVLWYTPKYTVHHPVGHVLPKSTLKWVQRSNPEEDVEFTVNGTDVWTRVPDYFYIIPQTVLTNDYPSKLPELLSCDSMWDDYKYSYDEFFKFKFNEHVPGTDPQDTIYYCVFSAHKAR